MSILSPEDHLEIFVTKEITLRRVDLPDAPALFSIIDSQREYLGKWLPFVSLTSDVRQTENYIGYVNIFPPETREDVLTISFAGVICGLITLKSKDNFNRKCEIGYWLSQDYQKKGIMTLSAAALCRYAFTELYMNRITIRCAAGNIPSKKIPKRLGFRFEGSERDGELLADGNFTDLEVYSLLKREWESSFTQNSKQ